MSEALTPLTSVEIQAMLDRSPFISFMGLKVTEADPAHEQLTMTCPMRPEFERYGQRRLSMLQPTPEDS